MALLQCMLRCELWQHGVRSERNAESLQEHEVPDNRAGSICLLSI